MKKIAQRLPRECQAFALKARFMRPGIVSAVFVIAAACLITLLALSTAARAGDADHPVSYKKIIPEGEVLNEGGIYDPTVRYDSDGKTGWLAYSTVLRGAGHKWPVPIGPYCETHLAKTTDGGQTWKLVKAVNSSIDATLKNFDGRMLKGVWRYEVPTLVHDPKDMGREWKLFAHRYFWSPEEDRMPAYGWIALFTAHDPAGEWSPETPLFGAGMFPPEPYHQTQVDLNTLAPNLRNSVAYSEPGAMCMGGTLYLSLTSLERTGPASIFLLASDDHGAVWRFIATLTTASDAAAFGYRRFDGSSLVQEAGRAYLLVSPESTKTERDGTRSSSSPICQRASSSETPPAYWSYASI